jgi:poly(hydroxyalkanoate) depolymerase family esterase
VVVLHGCTQTAASYAAGAGWIQLADQIGFVLLCPEQQTSNNQNRCFNWFERHDVSRGEGECASIRAMVEHAITEGGLDRSQVFVAGLSAGGAMASALLASYPDVFAAGAIVAGLPYGAASGMQEAFGAMFHPQAHSASSLGDRVRQASGLNGAWPRVSVWQGDADHTVAPLNAREIIKQWVDIHGLDQTPDTLVKVGRSTEEAWLDGKGQIMVEAHTIAGMGHGTPISTDDGVGSAGPFVLDVGVCSTGMIAHFFGLGDAPPCPRPTAEKPKAAASGRPAKPAASSSPQLFDVNSVINDALRSAGLLKR